MQDDGKLDRAQAETVIAAILAPYIGPSMARAAVEAHAARIQIEGDSLTREQITQLIERLAKGMRIFVGEKRADELARELLPAVSEQVST